MAKNSKVKNKKVEGKKALCFMCNKEKSLNKQNFFSTMSNSEKHKQYESIGYILPCKDCLRSMCFDSNNIVNINKVHEALEYLDIPFIQEEFDKMIKDGEFDLGKYKQRMSINKKYRDLLYEDSDDNSLKVVNYNNDDGEEIKEDENDSEDFDIEKDFKITREMYERFGDGFSKAEYIKLDKTYNDIVAEYGENSTISQDLYVDYAKNVVLTDRAILQKETGTYKDLINAREKIMKSANIQPSNKTSDMSGVTPGTLIKMLEEFQPVSKVNKQFEDVDNIRLYTDIFMKEPILRNMGKSTEPVEKDFDKIKELKNIETIL